MMPLLVVVYFFKRCQMSTEWDVQQKLMKLFPHPAYVYLPQVKNQTGIQGKERYADGIAFSVWPSRGLHVYGFEIKCSKSDLKKELADPEKAEEFARVCDYWYVAIANEKIVDGLIVPHKWGIITCQGKTAKITRKATKQDSEPIGKALLFSIMRRLYEVRMPSILMNKEIQESYARGKEDGRKLEKNKYSMPRETYQRLTNLEDAVDKFERITGINIARGDAALKYHCIVNIVSRAEKCGMGFLHALDQIQMWARTVGESVQTVKNQIRASGSCPTDMWEEKQ